MTRAYSIDLRERVVRQVGAGGSVRRVAAMFAVSPSFVVKLTQAWQQRGTVAARLQGGDRSSTALERHRDWLLQLVAETRLRSLWKSTCRRFCQFASLPAFGAAQRRDFRGQRWGYGLREEREANLLPLPRDAGLRRADRAWNAERKRRFLMLPRFGSITTKEQKFPKCFCNAGSVASFGQVLGPCRSRSHLALEEIV
jgi:hypothetical protein